MKNLFLFLLLSIGFSIHAQEDLNIEMISNTPVGEDGNDVWGWVDEDGTEYAIMGSLRNTWIWSLEDPASPTLRAKIAGDNSTWRDIKSWEDHLYVTTDSGDDGLLVIDMSLAPDSIRSHYITPPVYVNNDTTALGPCHNIYIDENGYAYLAGCRIGGARKAIIFDLNEDKWNPTIVGAHGFVPGGGEYAHDVYVKNNILYACEIYQGQLTLYDVTRKDSLVPLGSQPTGFDFTHNAWASNDQRYVFTTDEVRNAWVEAYDVSDPTDIKFLDRFQPLETQGMGIVPHNTHYFDGYLVTSYYMDGIVIIDASKPDNLIKTGAYDTYESMNGQYDGCWGAYPYLPSGLLLASDIQRGLFVFQPNYVRAALLEGTITDKESGLPINGVSLEIHSDQANFAESDAAGNYKTGIATAGEYTIEVLHPDYLTLTTEVELINGEVTIQNIELVRVPQAMYSFNIRDSKTGDPIEGAKIELVSAIETTELTSNEDGMISQELDIRDYNATIGSWGYATIEQSIEAGAAIEFEILLDPGYADDFRQDLGWESNGDATAGLWTRVMPQGSTFGGGLLVSPDMDIPQDEGSYCYVTGVTTDPNAARHDIDNGYVQLKSPPINVAEMGEPHLKFYFWFVAIGGAGPSDDTLRVYLHENDGDSIQLVQYEGMFPEWNGEVDINLDDFGVDTTDFRISFYASDKIDSGHVVKAAIDGFSITDEFVSSSQEQAITQTMVSPNPFSDQLFIEFEDSKVRNLELYDMSGRRLLSIQTRAASHRFQPRIDSGQYLLRITDAEGNEEQIKIIKI